MPFQVSPFGIDTQSSLYSDFQPSGRGGQARLVYRHTEYATLDTCETKSPPLDERRARKTEILLHNDVNQPVRRIDDLGNLLALCVLLYPCRSQRGLSHGLL